MRVTERMNYENVIRYLEARRGTMEKYQEQISSTKLFQEASDDPARVSAALSLRSKVTESRSYLSTITASKDWVEANENALKSLSALYDRAMLLIERGLSDTVGEDERRDSLGTELDGILKEALDVANTRYKDAYLFSGFRTETAPFEQTDEDTIVPRGSTEAMLREIEPGQMIQINLNGQEIFTKIFSSLIDARNALYDNDLTDLRTAYSGLEEAMQTANQNRTLNGARQRRLLSTEDRMEKVELELKSLLSLKEDTNLVEAVTLLREQENIYQVALEVSQRAISALSLFDMMR